MSENKSYNGVWTDCGGWSACPPGMAWSNNTGMTGEAKKPPSLWEIPWFAMRWLVCSRNEQYQDFLPQHSSSGYSKLFPYHLCWWRGTRHLPGMEAPKTDCPLQSRVRQAGLGLVNEVTAVSSVFSTVSGLFLGHTNVHSSNTYLIQSYVSFNKENPEVSALRQT